MRSPRANAASEAAGSARRSARPVISRASQTDSGSPSRSPVSTAISSATVHQAPGRGAASDRLAPPAVLRGVGDRSRSAPAQPRRLSTSTAPSHVTANTTQRMTSVASIRPCAAVTNAQAGSTTLITVPAKAIARW